MVKTHKHLWKQLCTYENLQDAYTKARDGKSATPSIAAFDKNPRLHLCVLLRELRDKTYEPRPLKRFVLRDPKTRVISVSAFRDRIVHHALINMIAPVFEPRFIHDSYASRKGKSTHQAVQRFDAFKRRASKNHTRACFVLKADIKHSSRTVDHETLIQILQRRIRDPDLIRLVRAILDNHESKQPGKGMPLGNWTSQYFANVYLNELDQFVKHELRAKHYIRYVDDFVILHTDRERLETYRERIDAFLKEKLLLELHPNKVTIRNLKQGIPFLGYRIFPHHKLLRKKSERKMRRRIRQRVEDYNLGLIETHHLKATLAGYNGYVKHADTHKKWQEILQYVLENTQQSPPSG